MSMCRLAFALLTLMALGLEARGEARVWKNPDGAEIHAEFVRTEGDNVTLRLANGKTVTFSQDKLSAADREWIKARPAEEKPAARGPASNRKASWLTQMEKAKKEAEETGLPILVLFTGSDWCPYCVKLEKEVFKQKEFKDYADQNLVLLIYDFPADGRARSEARQAGKDFRVSSYPTYFLITADGKRLAANGYAKGISPKSFADWVEAFRPKG